MRSRLKQNIKKQNTKNLVIIFGILLILAIFGTKLLIGFSVIIDKIKGDDNNAEEVQNIDYIAPPTLNPLPDATNKDKIEISGFTTSSGVSVVLYINGKKKDTAKSNNDNVFIFKDIILDKGENEIKAKSITDQKKQSDYSQVVNISYLDKEPNLEIKEPTDGQKFKKDQSPIRISGTTDPGAKITVNDFWAITSDNGEFYYMYSLKDGGNNLKITSTDQAGNKTTKEININVE